MLLLKSKISILIFLILNCVGFFQLQAQNRIKVKDAAFAEVLCENFPDIMNTTCDSLDLDAVNAIPDDTKMDLIASSRGIKSVDELKYITELDSIILDNNEITEFPELRNTKAIKRIRLINNLLTVAPKINIPGTASVRALKLQGNRIISFPTWEDDTNAIITSVDISENRLMKLPNLNLIKRLSFTNVSLNNLSFSDLIAVANHNNYDSNFEGGAWFLFPQNKFLAVSDTTVLFGSSLYISVKDKTPNNVYYLVSNTDTLRSVKDGQFFIESSEIDEGAAYKIVIRNSKFKGELEYLESIPFKLTVNYLPNVKEKDHISFSPNGDGISDYVFLDGEGEFIIYSESGESIFDGVLPFNWLGVNRNGATIEPGLYYVKTEKGYVKILASF